MSEMNDQQLVKRALMHEEAAFEELVCRHSKRVLSSAMRVTGNEPLAEEAATEAFALSWIHLDQLREQDKYASWVSTIAANEARRLIRVSTQWLDFDEELFPATKEDYSALYEAIAALPRVEEVAVRSYYLEGYSVKEVAKQTGESVSTVKYRLFSARKRLRTALSSDKPKKMEEQIMEKTEYKVILSDNADAQGFMTESRTLATFRRIGKNLEILPKDGLILTPESPFNETDRYLRAIGGRIILKNAVFLGTSFPFFQKPFQTSFTEEELIERGFYFGLNSSFDPAEKRYKMSIDLFKTDEEDSILGLLVEYQCDRVEYLFEKVGGDSRFQMSLDAQKNVELFFRDPGRSLEECGLERPEMRLYAPLMEICRAEIQNELSASLTANLSLCAAFETASGKIYRVTEKDPRHSYENVEKTLCGMLLVGDAQVVRAVFVSLSRKNLHLHDCGRGCQLLLSLHRENIHLSYPTTTDGYRAVSDRFGFDQQEINEFTNEVVQRYLLVKYAAQDADEAVKVLLPLFQRNKICTDDAGMQYVYLTAEICARASCDEQKELEGILLALAKEGSEKHLCNPRNTPLMQVERIIK